jgi:hypothetical protein
MKASSIDAHRAGQRSGRPAQFGQRGADLDEGGSHSIQQLPPRVGQGHAAGGAIEKPGADPIFEIAHPFAQRRRRHPQFAGGAAEVEMAGKNREKLQRWKVRTHQFGFSE